ncbi:MAG: glutamate 5-kinase [Thermaerobacter sp.]|nr:glutamate 5-kinase [Thermaerobacter sp.]
MSEGALSGVRRLVVKVGSSTVTHPTGGIHHANLERLARQLADLRGEGRQVLLVTSGAIAAGRGRLPQGGRGIVDKQALAAVGQGVLMHAYERCFAEYGQTVGQVLLTREDLRDPHRRQNLRRTLLRLMEWGVVPVVNENDSVAVEEIREEDRAGGNDTLSALVTDLVEAELLVLLSDVAGLFTGDPRRDATAQLVRRVREVTPQMEEWAGGAGSSRGTGGMRTKLAAARLATSRGSAVVIADGGENGVLRAALAGEAGTLFLPAERKTRGRESLR